MVKSTNPIVSLKAGKYSKVLSRLVFSTVFRKEFLNQTTLAIAYREASFFIYVRFLNFFLHKFLFQNNVIDGLVTCNNIPL